MGSWPHTGIFNGALISDWHISFTVEMTQCYSQTTKSEVRSCQPKKTNKYHTTVVPKNGH